MYSFFKIDSILEWISPLILMQWILVSVCSEKTVLLLLTLSVGRSQERLWVGLMEALQPYFSWWTVPNERLLWAEGKLLKSTFSVFFWSKIHRDLSPCEWVPIPIVLLVVMFSVSHKNSHGRHPVPNSSVVITHFWKFLRLHPGKQPCLMVIAEIFRNGPYYHGIQCVSWEYVWHLETQKTLPLAVLYNVPDKHMTV